MENTSDPLVTVLLVLLTFGGAVGAQPSTGWVTSWFAASQGPFPSGNASAQPNQGFAFPVPSVGATDQTFRLIVRPDIWGTSARFRFTNVFGTQPVTLDGAFVAVQLGGAAIVPGTSAPIHFGGRPSITLAPGAQAWSDPAPLSMVRPGALLSGRKLAVSLHVVGSSGPMTWHAKALTTSYVTAPGAGAHGADLDEAAFPFSTASWFFLDAVDMLVPADTRLVVAFGDSITDGTASTMNGDDRWPDALSRRLHAAYGDRVAIVNAGIGGNQVAGPAHYAPAAPVAGGPSAEERLTRDVLSLSGVSSVIWLEGINDFSRDTNASVDTVTAVMRRVVGRLHSETPGVIVVGATLTSALNSANGAHGSREEDARRQALNTFIRTSGVFDHVADFDAATLDPATGELQARFVPDSTTGGAGDKLHPNRAGYAAMAAAVDLAWFRPPQ